MSGGLLECLLVCCIMSVLVLLGGQAWQSSHSQHELRYASQLLSQYLFQVRSSAILHHEQRCLCRTNGDYSCQQSWQKGEVSMVGKHAIHKTFYWPKTIAIDWHSNLAHNQSLCFDPQGTTHGQMGYFKLLKSSQAQYLHVNMSGEMWSS